MLRIEADIVVQAAREEVGRFLAEVDRIVWYDERVAQIVIQGRTGDGRTVVGVHGRVAGWPYHVRCILSPLPCGGYQADRIAGPLPWASRRLRVVPAGVGTRLVVTEVYRFGGGWSAWIRELAWAKYLQRSTARELRLLKTLIEAEIGCRGPRWDRGDDSCRRIVTGPGIVQAPPCSTIG